MVLFLRIDLFSDIKEGIHPALAACVFWQVVLEGYRIVGDKTNKGGNYAFIKNTKQVQRGELLSGHPEIARIFIAINICCNRFFGRLRITSNIGLL